MTGVDEKEMKVSIKEGVLTIQIDVSKLGDEGVKHTKPKWDNTAWAMAKPFLKRVSVEKDIDLIKDSK